MTAPFVPQITLYQKWLKDTRGLVFADYEELRQWSIDDLDAFWQSVWDYFDIRSEAPHTAVLAKATMPGAQWFPGARINYAFQALRHVEAAHAAGMPAILASNEKGEASELSWPELKRQVASLALQLQALGVKPGDRVAAYMPNIPATAIAMLATVSIGAIWSVCAPDMGTAAVLDRFRQIEPTVLIASDGVTYGGRDYDRAGVIGELRASLPSVRKLIVQRNLRTAATFDDSIDFAEATRRDDAATAAFEPLAVPFDHPLWIVYSSGTTGLPKPIVHGHGGILLVALAHGGLHNDIGCSYAANSFGERYHWYSSTGWVMWNAQVNGLLMGATCCIYDGNPGGTKERPDWGTLWRFASEVKATFFGAGAAFYANCQKAGVDLSTVGDLSRIRALGATGSPLSEDVQKWGTEQFAHIYERSRNEAQKDIWWCNISGGTDFAGAFVGGNREMPLVPGEMQCRQLGCAVEAWNDQGEPVIDEVGELVCVKPIPSMPVFLWGDTDYKRYLSSYFDVYPGVWRHGDWLRIKPNGGCIIYGRSDATINRYGLRMGTSEIYSAVEGIAEILDSMVVDLEYLGRESYMPLFVVLREGVTLDKDLENRIHAAIRTALSPRFAPNDIFHVPEIPRTLSGKKQELPIKKLLLGHPLEKIINVDAMANPGSLEWYVAFARQRRSSEAN